MIHSEVIDNSAVSEPTLPERRKYQAPTIFRLETGDVGTGGDGLAESDVGILS